MIPVIDSKFEIYQKKTQSEIFIETVDDVKEISFSFKGGYASSIYYEDSYYKVDKLYYPSGNIKNKSISFVEGSPIDILYHFDELGKLIKQEDTDQGYIFKPKDVVEYCRKNKIKLPKGYQDSGYQTRVLKQQFNAAKAWRISHQIAGDKIEEIILHGKTGEVLQKKIIPFYNP